jgi:hypothetical protein
MHRFVRGKNKYRNVKTEVDGIKFDSKKEAKRYGELKLLEKSGRIRLLECQPSFILQEGFSDERLGINQDGSAKKARSLKYTADFQYQDCDTGRTIVEDVKSDASKTEAYRLRLSLFLYRYKDVDFREV